MFMANVAKQKKRSGAKRATRPAVAKKKTVTTAVKKSATAAKKTSTVKKGASVVKKKAVKKSAAKKASKDMTRYRCKLCGYIYSPFRGEPHNGIPAGTSFDDLPDDYVCPICGQEGKGRIGKWGFEEWRPTRYLCSLCNYIYDEKRGSRTVVLNPERNLRIFLMIIVVPCVHWMPQFVTGLAKFSNMAFPHWNNTSSTPPFFLFCEVNKSPIGQEYTVPEKRTNL